MEVGDSSGLDLLEASDHCHLTNCQRFLLEPGGRLSRMSFRAEVALPPSTFQAPHTGGLTTSSACSSAHLSKGPKLCPKPSIPRRFLILTLTSSPAQLRDTGGVSPIPAGAPLKDSLGGQVRTHRKKTEHSCASCWKALILPGNGVTISLARGSSLDPPGSRWLCCHLSQRRA